MRHELAGVLEGERFDVDDAGGESRGIHRRPPLLDVLGARRDQQHVVGLWSFSEVPSTSKS